jgi:regulatory protein
LACRFPGPCAPAARHRIATNRPPKPLKARAVALLARREYSRAEIRAKLVAGGESDPAEIDRVLDELAAAGLLSDARFADAVVAHKARTHGKRAIGAALKAHGIDDEAIARAIDAGAIDDERAMIALWRRRFGKAPVDDREKARQIRFLQSRGFSLSAILKMLRDPPEETGDR